VDSLRPKIYLVCCVLALLLESTYMFLSAPAGCVLCKQALAPASREYPTQICQKCWDEIRARIEPPAPVYYDPPYPIDSSDPVVTLDTTRGKIEVELFVKQAPASCENFLRYVKGHHYDGVIFHRIEDFLCVTGRHKGGYGTALTTIPQFAPIPSESANGLQNRIGTLSLPHLDENENSATSDFFFNLKENDYLNRKGPGTKNAGYCVFGQVLTGFDHLDGTRHLPVVDKPFARFPRDPIAIRRAFLNAPQTTGSVAALGSLTETGR